ncbi:hypothetical protein MVES1_003335 [Malassezia vespertilionis]|uniref:uncharacterized protein n=1 Tax=Malassezia vespertilionis TaxID=2020962 RepID=UPI0024B16E95|nr:uncharacterized protein MVES1_003335 [Malassezia vespertilionis]WFD07966.1 hypothetical protein MVES1_003335 [Malassezia vespertilionis]
MVNISTLKTTPAAHAPVHPLGYGPLHGPRRNEHIVVVLGVGPGLGLSIASVFAAQGYTTAILSRSKERLDQWAQELDTVARARLEQDGECPAKDEPLSLAFACDMLEQSTIHGAMQAIQNAWPKRYIGTCAYNGSIRKRGPFLDIPFHKIEESVAASIFAFFTFAQLTLRAMDKHGMGGSLLVTGASSSTRGAEGFAPFAAAKSIAREFGEKNVHVAHIIIDGLVESKTALQYLGLPADERFEDGVLAKTWLFLAQQDQSAWTFELDIRPAKEKF